MSAPLPKPVNDHPGVGWYAGGLVAVVFAGILVFADLRLMGLAIVLGLAGVALAVIGAGQAIRRAVLDGH